MQGTLVSSGGKRFPEALVEQIDSKHLALNDSGY
jgi:hypothetical protein